MPFFKKMICFKKKANHPINEKPSLYQHVFGGAERLCLWKRGCRRFKNITQFLTPGSQEDHPQAIHHAQANTGLIWRTPTHGRLPTGRLEFAVSSVHFPAQHMDPNMVKTSSWMARICIYLHNPADQLAHDIPWRDNIGRYWKDDTKPTTHPIWPRTKVYRREIRLDCLDEAELPVWACTIAVFHKDSAWLARLSPDDMAALVDVNTMYQVTGKRFSPDRDFTPPFYYKTLLENTEPPIYETLYDSELVICQRIDKLFERHIRQSQPRDASGTNSKTEEKRKNRKGKRRKRSKR